MDELIEKKQSWIKLIKQQRQDIAELKEKRAVAKAPLWEEATGTVDAKKDYIKSKIADIDRKIAFGEANIEYLYNMIDVITDKMVYCDE